MSYPENGGRGGVFASASSVGDNSGVSQFLKKV